jgi:predicted RNase H-like HicB family nuclease
MPGVRRKEVILSVTISVGQRDGKWHAVVDDPDCSMEGPARDTEAEAIADRDHAAKLFETILLEHMPKAVITKSRVQ